MNGRTGISKFRAAIWYIAPEINLATLKGRLGISTTVMIKGQWIKSAWFQISEEQCEALLKAIKDKRKSIKEQIKNEKGE